VQVLFSFGAPRPTTNPYITQLYRAVGGLVPVQPFSWSTALRGDMDVFHAHWPEILLRGSSGPKTAARGAAFAAMLARLESSRRIAVVRTIHNLVPHEALGSTQQRLLARLDRRTDLWIALNDRTPSPDPDATVVIPLGHYRDWVAGRKVPERGTDELFMFGFLRPYKGVEDLFSAFAGLPGEFRLTVVGQPYTPEYGRELAAAAAPDPRATLIPDFAAEEELVERIGRARLVVLPYRTGLNSSAMLLALSLGRPVLVPAGDVNDDLAAEVGAAWVQRFEPPLSSAALAEALEATAELPASPPDLSLRDWDRAAMEHVAAYENAMRRVSARRRSRSAPPRRTAR
jgi:beta-1,4-mannosyltransferase